jgi:hypothetical protein
MVLEWMNRCAWEQAILAEITAVSVLDRKVAIYVSASMLYPDGTLSLFLLTMLTSTTLSLYVITGA